MSDFILHQEHVKKFVQFFLHIKEIHLPNKKNTGNNSVSLHYVGLELYLEVGDFKIKED